MGRRKKAWATGAGFLLAALFVGCGTEKTVIEPAVPAITVVVTATPNTLDTGGRVVVKAQATSAMAGTFSYAWSSAAGVFANAKSDSTVWTAPDDPGVYSLSVIVTDGKDVGTGSQNVGVAVYLPAETPFYRGATWCATCHNGGPGGNQFATWKNSVHAGALGGLASIGMDRNATCLPCHTVGSKGLMADPARMNGGYDETAVPRLAGVQCENCHGPGSEHPTPTLFSVKKSLDASLCGGCHNDAHHPTYEEWQTSAHSGVVEDAALNRSCAKCHNGFFSGEFLDNPEAFANPAVNPDTALAVTCAVCHDPHGNDNPGSLRDASVTDRAIPNGVVVARAGAGRLCIACHNGRRTTTNVNDQIANGSAHFGPHHSVQGDMLSGVNAYQGVNAGFSWASSKHLLVQDGCVNCHTHAHAGDPENGIPNFMGHDFRPRLEACQPCHGTLAAFTDVMAKQDYDGDGGIEGVQEEVVGLLDQLEEAIIEHVRERDQASGDALAADFEGQVGVATVTTPDERKAAYNWAYVAFDGSKGVHNAAYAVQLLQQSILFLEPTQLSSNAYILRRAE